MTVALPTRSVERQEVSSKKPQRRALRIFSVLVWQLMALLFVEGVLYWAGLGEEDIYKLDRTLGFCHFQNKRVTWRSEGFSISYFNADGMRERGLTVEKPAGVYRIALLGDSMTEGIQVPIEQTFGKLAEKQLNGQLHRPIQVINFGNSGYSTVQEYLLLKEKVLRYKPDLVLLNYSNRDMFENWTAPDATITNLRPVALALPGKPLVVENESVKHWMRGTRGRIMVETQWIRQHSRIWGLITATQTQLSISDPFYRGLIAFFSNPVKSIKQGIDAAKHFDLSQIKLPDMSAPSFKIKFFENKQTALRQALSESSVTSAPKSAPNFKFVTMPQLHTERTAKTKSAAPLRSITRGAASEQKATATLSDDKTENTGSSTTSAKAQDAKASVAPAIATNGNKTYVALMSNTLHALLEAMQAECQSHGVKFAVCLLPSRAQLSPAQGVETNFFNITYKDEERYVTESCKKLDIPLFDAEQAAESALPDADRPNYFYLMHFNAKGHKFFAKQVTPFLAGLVPPANSSK